MLLWPPAAPPYVRPCRPEVGRDEHLPRVMDLAAGGHTARIIRPSGPALSICQLAGTTHFWTGAASWLSPTMVAYVVTPSWARPRRSTCCIAPGFDTTTLPALRGASLHEERLALNVASALPWTALVVCVRWAVHGRSPSVPVVGDTWHRI
jgi:hypothetical protein